MRSSRVRSHAASAYLLSTGLALLGTVPARGLEPRSDGKPLVGVYGGTGNRTVDKSIELGVDVLFPAITWHENPPFLKNIADKAHKYGIELYPSLGVAYDGYGDKHTEFAAAHPECWEKRRDGRLINSGAQVGLSFGYPEVRKHKVDTLTQIVKERDVDGVLLDYCRYFGNDAGYSDIIVEAFKRRHGKDPYKIPNEDPEWIRFRAGYVTQFVRELRESIDRVDPEARILACVGPDPDECLTRAMQDWATWLDMGLIDGVVTMIYERDTNNTLRQVLIANETIRGRVTHMPMIAPYGNNLTTPEMLAEGSLKCLTTGTRAVGYYRSDSIFKHELWGTIGEVAAWDLAEVQRRPVNYAQNPGFEQDLANWAIGEGEGVELVTDSARSGEKSLRMTFPGYRAARQIVDRGWLPGKRGVTVSAWLDDGKLSEDGRIFVDVSVNGGKGRESAYRVAVERPGSTGWHKMEVALPVRPSEELNHIIVSIVAEASDGVLCADDVALHLTNEAVRDDRFRVPPEALAPPSRKGRNVVRGQIVRGSSFWENGFDYDNAVDGNLSNEDYGRGAAWHSQRPAKDQWIKIYLPAVEKVSRFRMLNASAQAAYRTHRYRIEVSANDHRYRKIAEGVLPDNGDTWTEVTIEPVEAKYIRFTGVTGFNLEYAVGLKEIEAY